MGSLTEDLDAQEEAIDRAWKVLSKVDPEHPLLQFWDTVEGCDDFGLLAYLKMSQGKPKIVCRGEYMVQLRAAGNPDLCAFCERSRSIGGESDEKHLCSSCRDIVRKAKTRQQ